MLERGVWYPSAAELGFPATRGGNGQVFRKTIRRKEARRTAVFSQLASNVAGAPAAATLLSSEFLCALPDEFYHSLRQACDRAGVSVVCIAYIREQREWLMSRYAQAVKSKQWTLSLQDYLRERSESANLDYAQRFKTFASAFGHERVVARLFQRDGMIGGDARIDLFDIMKVDVRDLIRDEPNANASASIEEIEVMRAVNLAQPERPFNHREFLRTSQSLFAKKQWQPSNELHRLVDPDVMREIKAHYDASNEALRREFFPDRAAPLFRSRIPDIYEVLSPAERINERSIELLLNHLSAGRTLAPLPLRVKRKKPKRPIEAVAPASVDPAPAASTPDTSLPDTSLPDTSLPDAPVVPAPKAKNWRSLFGR